ncbi:hypothetical protein PUN28_017699 [Cardiocondyla obscurior]|uniref:Uncharacterized protein n=1 Tax=Cardiocondyla obscurior TaxID=286306 RepID=A0AAW2EKY1_9HYME
MSITRISCERGSELKGPRYASVGVGPDWTRVSTFLRRFGAGDAETRGKEIRREIRQSAGRARREARDKRDIGGKGRDRFELSKIYGRRFDLRARGVTPGSLGQGPVRFTQRRQKRKKEHARGEGGEPRGGKRVAAERDLGTGGQGVAEGNFFFEIHTTDFPIICEGNNKYVQTIVNRAMQRSDRKKLRNYLYDKLYDCVALMVENDG